SHRLASRTVTINEPNVDDLTAVIPGKSLNELNKILDDDDEIISISLTNNLVLFKTESIHFLSRLLDGKYPETSRLIPDEQATTLHVNTQQFMQTIDRASLLASQDRNQVVKLETKDNHVVEISSESLEIGNVVEKVTISEHTGEPLKISFSAAYMNESL